MMQNKDITFKAFPNHVTSGSILCRKQIQANASKIIKDAMSFSQADGYCHVICTRSHAVSFRENQVSLFRANLHLKTPAE